MMSQQGDNAHRSGRHFRTKLMSRYIGAGQNDRFDVRMQELESLYLVPSKIPILAVFELLKQVPQYSHQTGHLGWNQYIGTLILS